MTLKLIDLPELELSPAYVEDAKTSVISKYFECDGKLITSVAYKDESVIINLSDSPLSLIEVYDRSNNIFYPRLNNELIIRSSHLYQLLKAQISSNDKYLYRFTIGERR